MNRRSFFGSIVAFAAAAVFPSREKPTDLPSPGPDWKLVTIVYHDVPPPMGWRSVADIYYDGKLQRQVRTGWIGKIGFQDTWRLWVREDGLDALEPTMDFKSPGPSSLYATAVVKPGTVAHADIYLKSGATDEQELTWTF